MQSRMKSYLKHIPVALAVLALVAITVMASQGRNELATADQPVATAASQTAGCSGQCAGCPNAQSEGPAADAASPTEGAVAEHVSDCSGQCEGCSSAHAESGESASVDAEKCVACVRCVNVAPNAFRMNPDTGKAEVIEGASAEDVALGAKACPVHAVIQ